MILQPNLKNTFVHCSIVLIDIVLIVPIEYIIVLIERKKNNAQGTRRNLCF